MRTMFINCLVGMSLFTAAASAQTIQYRWTERHNQNVIGPGQIPVPNDNTVGTGTDATFWLALEARVIGGGSLGVSSFSGDVIMNDAFGTRGFFWGAASTQPDAAAGSMVNSARSNASFNTRYRGYTDSSGVPLATGRGIFNPYRALANSGDLAQGVLNDTDLAMPGLQTPMYNGVYGLAGELAEADYLANVSPAGGNPLGSPAHFGVDEFVPLFIIGYNATIPDAQHRTWTFEGEIVASSGFEDGRPVEASRVSASITYSIGIPAPGSAAMLALGGVLAFRRRR